jgi:predicted nuclease with TOPRIM domain
MDAAMELMRKWRARANSRLSRIQELEEQVSKLQDQNMLLYLKEQEWKAKYESQTKQIEAIRKTNGYLYKILKKVPGYGEA